MAHWRTTFARNAVTAGLTVVSLVSAGCFSSRATSLRQYHDPKTAATITVGEQMLVFARDRPERAAHARDYLTLVPLDVNLAGTHRLLVLIYDWSTVEPAPGARSELADRYVLVADGRQIGLEPGGNDAQTAGLSATPVEPPSHHTSPVYAPITREALAYLVDTKELRAVRSVAGGRVSYDLWRDDRGSIASFLAELPATLP